MSFRLKLAVAVLAILPMNGSLLACMLPFSWMNDAERECCATMQESCGDQEGMPASHTCCASVVRPHQVALVSPHFSLSPDVSGANLPNLSLHLLDPQVAVSPFREHTHSPPPVELAALHILRI